MTERGDRGGLTRIGELIPEVLPPDLFAEVSCRVNRLYGLKSKSFAED